MNEQHLLDLTLEHVQPPPSPNFLQPSLIPMGFPQKRVDSHLTLCIWWAKNKKLYMKFFFAFSYYNRSCGSFCWFLTRKYALILFSSSSTTSLSLLHTSLLLAINSSNMVDTFALNATVNIVNYPLDAKYVVWVWYHRLTWQDPIITSFQYQFSKKKFYSEFHILLEFWFTS